MFITNRAAFSEEVSSFPGYLVGKPKEKGPLGRPRRRRGNNIIMGLNKIG
jgi:hypothetical protein